jgi:hypothetical protein
MEFEYDPAKTGPEELQDQMAEAGFLGERLTRNLGIPEAILQFTDWAISFAALAGIFPLRLQTTDGVAARLAELVVYRLDDDYFQSYRDRVLAGGFHRQLGQAALEVLAIRGAAGHHLAQEVGGDQHHRHQKQPDQPECCLTHSGSCLVQAAPLEPLFDLIESQVKLGR